MVPPTVSAVLKSPVKTALLGKKQMSETPVAAGYQANVIGFGWTNGVFLELLHDLPKESVEALEKEVSNGKSAQK